MSMDQKFVVAIITQTPKPIYFGISAIVVAFLLSIFVMDMATCASPNPGHGIANAISFNNRCHIGDYTFNEIAFFISVFVIFLILSVIVFWIVHKAFEDAGKDSLSEIREKLRGEWTIEAMDSDGTPWMGSAKFDIEHRFKKLSLVVELPARKGYEPQVLTIYEILLNPRHEPISVSYFIDESFPMTDGRHIHRSIVTKLRWHHFADSEILQGSWYDLAPANSVVRPTGTIKFSRLRQN